MGYVYKITNTVNNKSYIGISIHEPEKKRIKEHLSGRGNRVIANAVKKYGKDAFTYEILEENVFDEFLPDLEVAYIANHNTIAPNGYNLDSGGSHKIPSEETRRKKSEIFKGKKRKPHSEETKRKISEANKNPSEETRRKMSEASKNPSAETRRKLSNALKGNRNSAGRIVSAETRRKISEGNTGKKRTAEMRRKISEFQRGKKRKPHSEQTRRKMSESHKGKRLSEAHRRKLSEANRHADYAPAHDFFYSLPPAMSLKEQRKSLYAKFPNVHRRTIRGWIDKWRQNL